MYVCMYIYTSTTLLNAREQQTHTHTHTHTVALLVHFDSGNVLLAMLKLLFSLQRGAGEDECDEEDGEHEMKRRFGTTVCQTPGIAYKNQMK